VRRAFYYVGVLLIAAALALVPVPLIVMAPAPAEPVTDRLQLEGEGLEPVNGDLLLTAVQLSQPSTLGAIAAVVDEDRDLIPRQAVIPADAPAPEYFDAQRRLFVESSRVAIAAGLRESGRPVEVTGGGAQIVDLAAEVEADTDLQVGDVIVEADGRRVSLAVDVVTAVARRTPGETVVLRLRRGDEDVRVDVPVRQLDEPARPGIGVVVTTVGLEVRLPVDASVDAEGIGGPSAGLVTALAAFDEADPVDLVAGRRIAVTGTVDLSGNVGAVGGVRQKVEAAERAGATILLVPEAEAGEARSAADTVTIEPVATLRDAIDRLAPR
jgi:PDZ domain-containing protein